MRWLLAAVIAVVLATDRLDSNLMEGLMKFRRTWIALASLALRTRSINLGS